MIGESLRRVALANRDRVAIVDGDQRLTYGDLLERVQGARAWLGSTLNCKPGDVIAAALENSWQFAACLFAVSEMGCILMPCNTEWRAAELIPLAGRLGFRGAIVSPRLIAEWRQVPYELLGAGIVTVAQLPNGSNAGALFSGASPRPDDPALYLCTSGSTGAPRLVPRSHHNLIANAENVARALAIGPGRTLLGVVPFHYSNGLNNSLLTPLLSGATVIMMPKFTPGACAERVYREQVDTLLGSPFLFGSLLEGVREPAMLASLQHCFTAGGRIPSGVVERWQDRFGVRIRQFYGMTEAGVMAIEGAAADGPHHAGVRMGKVLRGVEAVVLGHDGVQLGPGEIGELAVRSAAVMQGYLGDPELSRSRFHESYFRTGDLGYVDSAGNLYLTGRIGRVLNIAGVKVDPVEVERAVEMLASVASCHVDTVSNGVGGEVIRARVVPREGFELTRREIIEQCRQQLAEYKFPRVVEFLKDSPANIGGKIPAPVYTGPH